LTLSAAATDGDHDLTYESINDTPANRPTTLIFTYKATVTIIQESALTDKNYYQDDNILINGLLNSNMQVVIKSIKII
jgi:hypothetical protein